MDELHEDWVRRVLSLEGLPVKVSEIAGSASMSPGQARRALLRMMNRGEVVRHEHDPAAYYYELVA
jgi:DNA-binding IclR family transcriptional regulator